MNQIHYEQFSRCTQILLAPKSNLVYCCSFHSHEGELKFFCQRNLLHLKGSICFCDHRSGRLLQRWIIQLSFSFVSSIISLGAALLLSTTILFFLHRGCEVFLRGTFFVVIFPNRSPVSASISLLVS